MSILSDKYKIPEPVIKNMISDGVIASHWSTYDEVNRLHKEGKTTTEISDITKMSVRYVQKILARTK
jgi:hypothetical protein